LKLELEDPKGELSQNEESVCHDDLYFEEHQRKLKQMKSLARRIIVFLQVLSVVERGEESLVEIYIELKWRN
jgi:hypothetical protein